MKLINKSNNLTLESIFGLEIITDSIVYSLYLDHEDIVLLLVDAKIIQINQSGPFVLLEQNCNGIGILQNNVFFYMPW